MKSKFRVCIIILMLVLSACSQNTQNGESSSATQSSDVPPTPYPDTPSPAAIDAPRVDAPALVSLDMLGELDGWGVTETQIVRTNDGGLTWYNVTPPDVAETGYSVDAFILDKTHAWVQKPAFAEYPNSGTLYRTTDGGITWTKSDAPFSRGALRFLDAENGWALADLGAGAGSNAVAIFQTSDGGTTWEQTYINDPNDPHASDSLPLGGIKSDLVPLNMQTAWVTGVTYAPGEIYLYRTDDGGHTWVQSPLKAPDGMENFEVSIDRDQLKFVSATDGFIALRISGDATQTAVYVTQDAGNTWAVPSELLDGVGASVFLSPQEAILYNGDQFYVTHDAARTWVTVPPDIKFGESFAAMEFVSTSTGWVITLDPTTNHRSLYRTLDGGTTWLPVVP